MRTTTTILRAPRRSFVSSAVSAPAGITPTGIKVSAPAGLTPTGIKVSAPAGLTPTGIQAAGIPAGIVVYFRPGWPERHVDTEEGRDATPTVEKCLHTP